MKLKRFINIITFVIILSLIIFNINYVNIDGKYYNKDTKEISVHSFNDNDIRKINRCTKIETIYIVGASKNSVSKFSNFHNLSDLIIMRSNISSLDSEKISTFQNLKDLFITYYTTIDFKGFKNNTISSIKLFLSEITNLESLSKSSMLKHLSIFNSIISDNYIIKEDNKYIMKDSSVFASFDYIEELWISVDKIEDISGILEMDSLKEFKIDKGTLSEEDKKLLEDKGISVIYYDKNE